MEAAEQNETAGRGIARETEVVAREIDKGYMLS